MQTGTSGCQYSWFTICLLLFCVFCYQHKQKQILSFNHSSVYLETITTTATTTINNFNSPILIMARIIDAEKATNQTNTWPTAIETVSTDDDDDEKISVMLKMLKNANTTATKININKTLLNIVGEREKDRKRENNCLIRTDLSDKEQVDTLTVSEQIFYVKQRQQHEKQKIYKHTKILPPMLMFIIMGIQECETNNHDDYDDDDDNDEFDYNNVPMFVFMKGERDTQVRRHLLSTRKTTIQKQQQQQKYEQQQQQYIEILMSDSTLFGSSVTAALVHLTTWPTAVVLLLFSSSSQNPIQAATTYCHGKLVAFVVVHNCKARNSSTRIVKSNVVAIKSENESVNDH